MSTETAREAAVRSVMDGWKDAIDTREPSRVATYFTEDAIFQGLHPYTVGREGIVEYYESQPVGLGAEYKVLETRQVADDVVLGYLAVDFTFTDRPTLHVLLGVLVRRVNDGWRIAHYQVSKLG